MRAVIVEDHAATAAAVAEVLAGEGLTSTLVADGGEAVDALRDHGFSLVVLDVRLPGPDGIEVCRTLRAGGDRTPVLMLTGRGSTSDVVRGLEAGADDYLAKPVALDELRARVRALLRRGGQLADVGPPPQRVGSVRIDHASRTVRRGDREVELTPREHSLLATLAEHPGRVLTRDRLLREVWPHRTERNPKVVDVYVSYLRRKLDLIADDVAIQAVRGVGYRLAVSPGGGTTSP